MRNRCKKQSHIGVWRCLLGKKRCFRLICKKAQNELVLLAVTTARETKCEGRELLRKHVAIVQFTHRSNPSPTGFCVGVSAII